MHGTGWSTVGASREFTRLSHRWDAAPWAHHPRIRGGTLAQKLYSKDEPTWAGFSVCLSGSVAAWCRSTGIRRSIWSQPVQPRDRRRGARARWLHQ